MTLRSSAEAVASYPYDHGCANTRAGSSLSVLDEGDPSFDSPIKSVETDR